MSQSIIRFDNPKLSHVWKADDDWTGLKEKEERKKRQNRLNQRAYRVRNAPKDQPSNKRRAFRVERFRITDPVITALEESTTTEPVQATATSEAPLLDLDSTSLDCLTVQDATDGSSAAATHADALAPQHFIPREALALLALDLDNPESSVLSAASAHYLQSSRATRASPVICTEPPSTNLTVLDNAIFVLQEKPFDLLKTEPLPNYFGSNLATSIFNVAYTASQALSSLDHTLMNETYFPLSSDHLLHLIHFNVFRALISNKLLLNDTTVLLRAGEEIVLPIHQNLCEGLTLVRTKNEKPIPRTLYPTTKQMSIAHSSWLNMFPYPQVRDNLIQHQKNFNHRDLCNDLFGELFFKNVQNSPYPNTTSAPNETASEVWETWEDDVTARRKGLIVWGEPWDVNAWEITPGFLKKWSWIIEGCEEIITASNRWRAQRDEPPLTYVTSSGPDPNAREPTYELPKNLYS